MTFFPTKKDKQQPLNKREASQSVVEVLNVSSKLRIKAVIWIWVAHQHGGPPNRTTTTNHFRSSPPCMELKRNGGSRRNSCINHTCAEPKEIRKILPHLLERRCRRWSRPAYTLRGDKNTDRRRQARLVGCCDVTKYQGST